MMMMKGESFIQFELDGKTRYVSTLYCHRVGHSVDPKRATVIYPQHKKDTIARIREIGGTKIKLVGQL